MECNPTNITQPTNSTAVPCDGVYTSTDCIVAQNAISYLQIVQGDSQTLINSHIALAIQNLQQQITDLTARVTALES